MALRASGSSSSPRWTTIPGRWTKLDIVANLHERIENKELENAVRNFIAKNPWLIASQWEMFQVGIGVKNLIAEAATKSGLVQTSSAGQKRVDLALSSGDHLISLLSG